MKALKLLCALCAALATMSATAQPASAKDAAQVGDPAAQACMKQNEDRLNEFEQFMDESRKAGVVYPSVDKKYKAAKKVFVASQSRLVAKGSAVTLRECQEVRLRSFDGDLASVKVAISDRKSKLPHQACLQKFEAQINEGREIYRKFAALKPDTNPVMEYSATRGYYDLVKRKIAVSPQDFVAEDCPPLMRAYEKVLAVMKQGWQNVDPQRK